MATKETFNDHIHDHMLRDTRVYLECPYHEKDEVKALGARWDNNQRRWFVPPGTRLDEFKPWMKRRIYLRSNNVDDQGTIESLGAKYDTAVCGYYILDSDNASPFQRWLP